MSHNSKCQHELQGKPGVYGCQGMIGKTPEKLQHHVESGEAQGWRPVSWLVAASVQGGPRPGGKEVWGWEVLGVSGGNEGG